MEPVLGAPYFLLIEELEVFHGLGVIQSSKNGDAGFGVTEISSFFGFAQHFDKVVQVDHTLVVVIHVSGGDRRGDGKAGGVRNGVRSHVICNGIELSLDIEVHDKSFRRGSHYKPCISCEVCYCVRNMCLAGAAAGTTRPVTSTMPPTKACATDTTTNDLKDEVEHDKISPYLVT